MNNTRIKFNDEFVKPRIADLLAVGIKRHTISEEQIKRVQEILEIDGDTLAK